MSGIRLVKCAAAIAALAASAFTASAQVMVSNLGTSPEGFSEVSTTAWFASSFTTGNSAPSFDLDEVTLGMDVEQTAGGNFFVAIYSDLSSLPGVQIAVLSGSADPSTAGNYVYSASGVTLSASTTYWVVAGVSSGSAVYSWNFVSGGTTDTWTIPDAYTSSLDSGANWDPVAAGPQQFSVSIVPEPTSAALLVLGALSGTLLRRRRA